MRALVRLAVPAAVAGAVALSPAGLPLAHAQDKPAEVRVPAPVAKDAVTANVTAPAQAAPIAAAPATPPPATEKQPDPKPAEAATAVTAPVAKPAEQAQPAAAAAPPSPRADQPAVAGPAAKPTGTSPAPGAEPQKADAGSPPADPIVTAVRAKLETAKSGDRAALAKVYAARSAPIWVSAKGGLNTNGAKAAAEIRKADDWGLAASAFDLPQISSGESSPEKLADGEIRLSLAVAKYANHARGGRIADPSRLTKHFDQKPAPYETFDLVSQIAESDEPDAYLRRLHPQHPQFERLRQALLRARGAPAKPAIDPAPATRLPEGRDLKPGDRHGTVALLRERMDVAPDDGDVDYYDEDLVDAVKAFQKEQGLPANGIVGKATRAALNGPPPGAPKPPRTSDVQRLVVNMERWRWLPDDMGAFHVWDNIPEFQMRVLKAGKVIHQEKIIVGKVETQTPLFSADMKYVIFHPDWGVPDSIKVKEILPYLRRTSGFMGVGSETDTRVLQKHNLRVSMNGRPVDASQVDWSTVDIRRYQFIQPPGGGNVLGVVKFRFPNKHDVYMHDTPQRDLFAKTVRTFSHGCMRVHNPRRLAEVLLAEDRGWGPEKIGQLLAGTQHEVTLQKRIPVHVTYFTAVVDDDGKLTTYGDIYGHDSRVAAALDGKPFEQIAASDPALMAEKASKRQPVGKRDTGSGQQAYNSMANFFSGLMGN